MYCSSCIAVARISDWEVFGFNNQSSNASNLEHTTNLNQPLILVAWCEMRKPDVTTDLWLTGAVVCLHAAPWLQCPTVRQWMIRFQFRSIQTMVGNTCSCHKYYTCFFVFSSKVTESTWRTRAWDITKGVSWQVCIELFDLYSSCIIVALLGNPANKSVLMYSVNCCSALCFPF